MIFSEFSINMFCGGRDASDVQGPGWGLGLGFSPGMVVDGEGEEKDSFGNRLRSLKRITVLSS